MLYKSVEKTKLNWVFSSNRMKTQSITIFKLQNVLLVNGLLYIYHKT